MRPPPSLPSSLAADIRSKKSPIMNLRGDHGDDGDHETRLFGSCSELLFSPAALGDRNHGDRREGRRMEVTACNTITNFGAGGAGGRKEGEVGRGRNKYFIGVGNRTEGVAGSGEALVAWLTFWAPDSPGQIRKARIISFLPCPALPTSPRRLL